MASFSFGINRGTIDRGPEDITVGTLAVSSNDIELRVDKTKGLTEREIVVALELFIRRINDGRYNDAVNI